MYVWEQGTLENCHTLLQTLHTLMLTQDCQLGSHYSIWGCPVSASSIQEQLIFFSTFSVLFIQKLLIDNLSYPRQNTRHWTLKYYQLIASILKFPPNYLNIHIYLQIFPTNYLNIHINHKYFLCKKVSGKMDIRIKCSNNVNNVAFYKIFKIKDWYLLMN